MVKKKIDKDEAKKGNKNKKVKYKVKLIKIKEFLVRNKKALGSIILFILDIILIIYMARSNSVNYVNVNGEDILVSSAWNLLFGRNYITLVVSLFIYIYFIIVNKMMLKIKVEKKYFIWLLVGILLFNMILFFMFTKRVY